jgi:LruC domain-containing protein
VHDFSKVKSPGKILGGFMFQVQTGLFIAVASCLIIGCGQPGGIALRADKAQSVSANNFPVPPSSNPTPPPPPVVHQPIPVTPPPVVTPPPAIPASTKIIPTPTPPPVVNTPPPVVAPPPAPVGPPVQKTPPPPVVQTPPPPVITFPNPENIATIVFEDNYPKPGDADFNDFVTNISVQEKVNTKGEIYQILIDFIPRAIGASYDHKLLLVLDGKKNHPTDSRAAKVTAPLFHGDADITLVHKDENGKVIEVQNNLPKSQDVVLFSSTREIFHHGFVNVAAANCRLHKPAVTAHVEINIKSPHLNPLGSRREVDITKYRVVLHVKNTNKDIDIVDVNPEMIDTRGLPHGFFVPTDWKWPAEGLDLRMIYPKFASYAAYLSSKKTSPSVTASEDVKNWFTEISPAFEKNLSHCE